jgi:hypothetical protein
LTTDQLLVKIYSGGEKVTVYYGLDPKIELQEAKKIIVKSIKSGKLLSEYKEWEKIRYDIKTMALFEMTCPLCHNVAILTGSWSHLFGSEGCCGNCDQRTNRAYLKASREEARAIFPFTIKEDLD